MSSLNDDGQHVAVLQLVFQTHALVVKFSAGSSYATKSELPNKIAVKFDADVLNGRIVLDDQRLFHVRLLPLGFEVDSHEPEVIVNEILEFVQANVLER